VQAAELGLFERDLGGGHWGRNVITGRCRIFRNSWDKGLRGSPEHLMLHVRPLKKDRKAPGEKCLTEKKGKGECNQTASTKKSALFVFSYQSVEGRKGGKRMRNQKKVNIP